MKVFISYAHQDQAFVDRLSGALEVQGIATWTFNKSIRVGDNLVAKINDTIEQSDSVIVVLSKASTRSQWLSYELSAFLVREIRNPGQIIFPVLVEDADIPVALQDRVYADFRGSFEVGIGQLLTAIKGNRKRSTRIKSADKIESKSISLDHQLTEIKTDYDGGNLALICGAGVSVGAQLPAWGTLLTALLSELIQKKASNGEQDHLAELFQESFRPTSLMIAQYLKNGLGKDFLSELRQILYRGAKDQSPLIDSIVELCRPQRSRQSIHSIISFNFDDLIELNLGKAAVRHRSIFKEGQRCKSTELPIYHVHGFLPRDGRLTGDHEVVFSEDAYHSQFIDSFSWSNLVQLTHLGQNRCLFVGLSLTDPNLRRLLDVSMRKNPDRTLYHYIFKKRYSAQDLNSAGKTSKKQAKLLADVIRIAEDLEEQDANNLGLNVIWIDSFDEIPKFFKRLASVG